jgi:hypothetical protein
LYSLNRLKDNWELFHLVNAILIMVVGVAGGIMLVDKKEQDEN